MHRTTGAGCIAAHHGEQLEALADLLPQALGNRSGEFAARLARGVALQRLADRRAGRPLALEAKGGDLRAGHLPDPDARFVAQRQQREIHRRKTGGAPVAHILVDDAVDHRDETASAAIARPLRPQAPAERAEQPGNEGLAHWGSHFFSPAITGNGSQFSGGGSGQVAKGVKAQGGL